MPFAGDDTESKHGCHSYRPHSSYDVCVTDGRLFQLIGSAAYAYQVMSPGQDATPAEDLVPYAIDYSLKSDGWQSGVLFSDGDGTVTLTSMGYMCAKVRLRGRNFLLPICARAHRSCSQVPQRVSGKATESLVLVHGHFVLTRNHCPD